jgi:hypothetical protein
MNNPKAETENTRHTENRRHTDAAYEDHTTDERSIGEKAMITGGSGMEILMGVGIIVLAILGLVKVAPTVTLSVAAIAVGAALILQGTTIAGEFKALLRQTSEGKMGNATFGGGGVGKELLGGLAGIGLGISALVGLIPYMLLPIAAIVLGCTFLASSITISRLYKMMVEISSNTDTSKKVADAAISDANGVEVLVGLAAITLGIVELFTGAATAVGATTIILVAFLILGVGTFLTSLSLNGHTLTSVSVRIRS